MTSSHPPVHPTAVNVAPTSPDGIPWRDVLYGVGFVTALLGGMFGVTVLGYRRLVRPGPRPDEVDAPREEPREEPTMHVEHPQPPSTLVPRPRVAPGLTGLDWAGLLFFGLLLVVFGGISLQIWIDEWLRSTGRCYAVNRCFLFHDNRNHALFAAAFGAVALLVARWVRAGGLVPSWDRDRVARLLERTAGAALVIALWAAASATWT